MLLKGLGVTCLTAGSLNPVEGSSDCHLKKTLDYEERQASTEPSLSMCWHLLKVLEPIEKGDCVYGGEGLEFAGGRLCGDLERRVCSLRGREGVESSEHSVNS